MSELRLCVVPEGSGIDVDVAKDAVRKTDLIGQPLEGRKNSKVTSEGTNIPKAKASFLF